jgi:hypothetical protein
MRRFILKLRMPLNEKRNPPVVWVSAVVIGAAIGCLSIKAGNIAAPDGSDASSGDVALMDYSVPDGRDATQSDTEHEGAANVGSDADNKGDVVVTSDGGQDNHETMYDGPDETGMGDRDSDSDARTDGDNDGAPTPLTIASPHLRLWLTAERGITCVSGRVQVWADQSGRGDDARPQQNQLGPQCQIQPAPHLINGIDVPYFSAPVTTMNPNVIDETLDVDLGFLVGSDYTIFVVERRRADYDTGDAAAPVYSAEAILGTTETNESVRCGTGPNSALIFGYIYYRGYTQISVDQNCNELSVAPNSALLEVTEDTAQLDLSRGHEIWTKGVPMAVNVDTTPLVQATGGAIGRGLLQTLVAGTDWRFRGDIAEVVIYDSALRDEDRVNVEAHLRSRWRY